MPRCNNRKTRRVKANWIFITPTAPSKARKCKRGEVRFEQSKKVDTTENTRVRAEKNLGNAFICRRTAALNKNRPEVTGRTVRQLKQKIQSQTIVKLKL